MKIFPNRAIAMSDFSNIVQPNSSLCGPRSHIHIYSMCNKQANIFFINVLFLFFSSLCYFSVLDKKSFSWFLTSTKWPSQQTYSILHIRPQWSLPSGKLFPSLHPYCFTSMTCMHHCLVFLLLDHRNIALRLLYAFMADLAKLTAGFREGIIYLCCLRQTLRGLCRFTFLLSLSIVTSFRNVHGILLKARFWKTSFHLADPHEKSLK